MDTAGIAKSIGQLPTFGNAWSKDLLAGFLVFLIALPLCLGISAACGYPPIAGIFTAIIGGILSTFISNSELTIKGPAAGLIVIAVGCIKDFGGNATFSDNDSDMQAYQIALGIGVMAAIIQILFGLLRLGILGEFFPLSVIHGMLAAIGCIIIITRIPVILGISAEGKPLQLAMDIPHQLMRMNPRIALIAAVSLMILFGMPMLKNRWLRVVPAPMIVILVTVPLGLWLGLNRDHAYIFMGKEHEIIEKRHLVNVPNNMLSAITYPEFSGLLQPKAWIWVFLFASIGTLESMLSSKAIDTIDPWKRRTNLNRDNLAVGVCNLLAACVGGLPMISEIVRSRANIDNGARTRLADFFHGLFLLGFVASVPFLIHLIPMAALGAMLIYTGFRLASPREFASIYMVGREQLVVFIVTIFGVLATDLLMGIVIGIFVKFLIHFMNGLPLRSVFKPSITVEERDANTYMIRVREAAVFTNWIPLRRRINTLDPSKNAVIDLSETLLVDHTVMEKLHELEREFEQSNRHLEITGLDGHVPFSEHPRSARRKARTCEGAFPVSSNGTFNRAESKPASPTAMTPS